MATFENGLIYNVGTTEQTVYTAPSGITGIHLIIGMIATNILGSALPITVKLIRGSDTHYIAFNRRVLPNDTIDLMMGTKISLKAGEVIKAYAPIDNSFSMIMSITEEVLG